MVKFHSFVNGVLAAVAAGLFFFLLHLGNRVSTLEGRVDTFMQMREEVNSLREKVIKVRKDVDTIVATTSSSIISPTFCATVGREFSYKIEIRNPKQEKYYYLANEVSGLQWPKARLHPSSEGGVISGQSNEGGTPPEGRFYIVVFEVDQEEHKRILRWLEGPDFPGIQMDGCQLAKVELQLE
jgi:hypothetical protein